MRFTLTYCGRSNTFLRSTRNSKARRPRWQDGKTPRQRKPPSATARNASAKPAAKPPCRDAIRVKKIFRRGAASAAPYQCQKRAALAAEGRVLNLKQTATEVVAAAMK